MKSKYLLLNLACLNGSPINKTLKMTPERADFLNAENSNSGNCHLRWTPAPSIEKIKGHCYQWAILGGGGMCATVGDCLNDAAIFACQQLRPAQASRANSKPAQCFKEFTTEPHGAQTVTQTEWSDAPLRNRLFAITGDGDGCQSSVVMTGEELDSLALKWLDIRLGGGAVSFLLADKLAAR